MNLQTLFFVFSYFFAAQGPVIGNPVKMKPGFYDPQHPDTSQAFPDFLIPRTEYPIKPKVCLYKGGEYTDGTVVTTNEPCLKCKCLGGSLICYLRVCPTLPDPPPPHCLLVLRKGACCSELVCEDGGLVTNHIGRAEPSNDVEHPLDSTISFGDGKGCIENGTLYASGSAMSTSSLCEYCYCISGVQHCVKPKCLLPVTGCQPKRSPHSCCPISYTCIQNDTQTTTTLSTFNNQDGCIENGVYYPEGERVSSKESLCTNCFCIHGIVQCANLLCAPPLLGCTPIIEPGKCCASSYNCTENPNSDDEGFRAPLYIDKSDTNKDMMINERSFPGDTLLTPSQIAEILMGSERRSTRNNDSDKQKGDKKNSKITVSIVTSPEEIDDTRKSNLNHQANVAKEKIISTVQMKNDTNPSLDDNIKTKNIDVISNLSESNNTNRDIINNTKENIDKNVAGKITMKAKPNEISDIHATDKNTTESSIIDNNSDEETTLDENYIPLSTVIINDSVNCTTEITSVAEINDTNESLLFENTTENIQSYNDTQERHPDFSDSFIAENSTSENEDIIHENSTKSGAFMGSQFPSHSLIIPKDDNVFMVNVSTFVRTNTSVVTLRPVAAIPPEIEAILNMSIKNQKDDYFDYDYKSALPPSLPNLEIIPFLATDAVVNEKKSNKKKINNKYDPVYPSIESKNYVDKFSPAVRDRHNATVFPYVTSTPYPSYHGDKYLTNSPIPTYNRNPVYKQHINDKFQATTYSTNSDKYENVPFAQEKYDNLPLSESGTESLSFDINGMNLFSPPVKTEGGFLPRDPPVNPYYDLGFSSTGEGSYSATDSSLMVTNHAKVTSDNCISNGREYKNGELITEPHACVVCFCYYGDIHCQDPECPPIKPGCRRIIEKSSSSCCGIEICNDEAFDSLKNAEHQNTGDTAKPVKTTPLSSTHQTKNTDLQPPSTTEYTHNTRNISMPTEVSDIRSTTGTISTFVIPSKLHIVTTTDGTTMTTSKITSTTSSKSTSTKNNTLASGENVNSSYNVVDEKLPLEKIGSTSLPVSESFFNSATENGVLKETTPENYDSDPFSEDGDDDDDDGGFNFDSVLKYLLGDDSTTRPPPKTTTKLFVTSPKPSTKGLFSSPRIRVYSPTTVISILNSPMTPATIAFSSYPTASTTERIHLSTQRSTPYKVTSSLVPFKMVPSTLPTQVPLHKVVHKFAYSKIPRNVTAAPFYKNATKPRITTKAPVVYSTIHRYTKLKFSPTPFPLTTESVKKIAPPSYPKDHYQQTYKRKPTPSDSTLPFGAGLLKLAGCNIYGRMYRVGKIISELSGPCLECMCTEVGVQCKTLLSENC